MSTQRLDLLGGGGLRLAADLWETPGEGSVLLLHGGGQTRHSWRQAGPRLQQHGLTAVAVDLRGHGDSEWADSYQIAQFGSDIVALVPQLPRPVVLVGASLGGIASMIAAPELGADLRALVLVDVVPRMEVAGGRRIGQFLRSAPDGFATLDEAADAIADYLPHRPRRGVTPGLRKNLRQRDDGRWYWHWDPAFVRIAQGVDGDEEARLEAYAAQLTVPVLVLRGVLSDVVSEAGVQRFMELVPQARAVDLAGAAHTAAADDNDMFVDTVVGFITSLETS